MSLATRCTACGTIFRIVEDQLQVSDGWVRCGRCAEVFDARELLFDIERDQPPAWPTAFTSPVSQPASMASAASAAASSPPQHLPEAHLPDPAELPAPHFSPDPPGADLAAGTEMREPGFDGLSPHSTSVDDDPRQEPHWVDEGLASASTAAPEALARTQRPEAVRAASASAPTAQDESLAPDSVPEFMRRAEAVQRWRSPGRRRTLGLLAVVLALGLAGQLVMHFRDALAAVFPATRATLVSLCQTVGCEVRPWRRAEVLKIDSSGLTQVGSRNGYRLNLTLRNDSAVDVAMPWVELTVSDVAGSVVARRVLPPSALSPALEVLPAQGEQALQFSFSTGSHRVSGYTVDVFQP